MAKLKLDDLSCSAIGFRPQNGENAKSFRERIGTVADKLTLTNRKQTSNEMKLHTRLTQLASDYDRAIAHRDRAIANGAEAGSSAFEGQYEGQWTTIDKGLEILENALREESKSPDYAKVSAMVKEARPAIFDAAKPDNSVKPEAKEGPEELQAAYPAKEEVKKERKYRLIAVNEKTGAKTALTTEPMTHAQAVTNKGKFDDKPGRRIELEEIDEPRKVFNGEKQGDFYEIFGENAKEAAKVLELTLTSKNGVPMVGWPYHAHARMVEQLAASGIDFSLDAPAPTSENVLDAETSLWSRITEGTATLEEFKAGFENWVNRKDEIYEALMKNTKDQLFKMRGSPMYDRYKSEPKAEIVSAMWRDGLQRYVLARSFSYGMGKNAMENGVRNMVENTDADQLAQYAKDRKAAQEEALARVGKIAEAIKDPKTLDDFQTWMRATMATGKTFKESRMSLTPEQRAQYDDLQATETRSKRKATTDDKKTSVAVAGQVVDGDIIATKHTKKGHDVFVVQLSERVSKDDYTTLNTGAKRIGGYYSSFRGAGAVPGFQFTTREQAQAFVKLAQGDSTEAQAAAQERRDAFADDRSQTAVERLTEMADRLEDQASSSLNQERKQNTAKRASQAASAEAAANAEKAMAKTMRNIAESITSGKAKFLDRVRQKTQVSMLQAYVHTAKNDELRAKYDSYAEQEKHKGEAPTQETADFAEFPTYSAYRSDLASLARQLVDVDGTKLMGQKLLKVADDVSDAFNKFAKENPGKLMAFRAKDGGLASFGSREAAERSIAISGYKGKALPHMIKRGEYTIILSPSEAIERGVWKGDGDKRITLSTEFGDELVAKIGKAARRGSRVSVPWQFESAHDKRKALERMGIETPAEFRAALREFIGLREQAAAPDKVKQLERSMMGRKNDGLDFFPTPESVADEMVTTAGIEPGMTVLEPSAGWGHIAERIRAAGVDPDVGEMASDRRELLEAKGFNLVSQDFMGMSPRGFTYGDVFRAPDGTLGVMRGSGGLGSGRVGLDPLDANGQPDMRRSQWHDRDDLVGVEKRASNSGYDRILMNPPFSDGRDIEHVKHAYTLLKPGGRIVAIMGESAFTNQNKKATEFREWLDNLGGTNEKLPEGSFADPSLPVNTGANARMVVIDRGTEEVRFSRSKQAFSPAARSQATDVVERQVARIKSKWKNAPKIIVAFDMADERIPAAVRAEDQRQRSGGAAGTPEGFYYGGTVYLMSSQLKSPGDVQRVLFHETLGHFGLRGTFGDGLKPILQQIATFRKAEVDAKIKEYGLRSVPDLDREIAAEEVLAEMAQNTPEIGFVKRAIAMIRTWLRENGFSNLTLTDDEIITQLILPARAFVEQGGKPKNTGGNSLMRSLKKGDWYSELSRQVMANRQQQMPAGMWASWIDSLKTKGVKPDEIEWSGVTDWLKMQPGKVTKQQVLAYLDANGVQVQEDVLGGGEPKVITSDQALDRLRNGLPVGWRRGDQVVQMHSPDSVG